MTKKKKKRKKKKQLSVEKSSTLESQQEDNLIIYKDKFLSLEKNILITNLSKILDQGLISKEKELKPFWNSLSVENSKKLWLPTEKDLLVLDSNSLSTFFPNCQMPKSWFSTKVVIPQTKNLPKISFPSLQFSPPKLTVPKEISKEFEEAKNIITIKARLKLNKSQRRWFFRASGLHRWIYNNSLDILKVLTNSPLYIPNQKILDIFDQLISILKNLEKKKKVQKLIDKVEKNLPLNNAFNLSDFFKKIKDLSLSPNEDQIDGLLDLLKDKKDYIKSNSHIYTQYNIKNIKMRDFLRKVRIIQEKWDVGVGKELIAEFTDYLYDEDNKGEFLYPANLPPSFIKQFPSRLYRGIINNLVQDINSCIGNNRSLDNIRNKTKKKNAEYLPFDQWCTDYIFPAFLKNVEGYYKIGRRKIDLKDLVSQIDHKSFAIYYEKRTRKFYLNLAITRSTQEKLKRNKPQLKESAKLKVHYIQNLKKLVNSKEKERIEEFLKNKELKKLKELFNKIEKNNLWKEKNEEKISNERISFETDENQVSEKRDIASLDPGIRTFMTLYGIDHCIEFGKEDLVRIWELTKKKDELKGKKQLKMQRKIENLVTELHWKIIKFLVKNYKIIVLPEFLIKQMMKGRKISKKTRRLMYAFSFYKFRKRLEFKAQENGVKLIIVDESYTSKTCGCCGKLNFKLGGKKVFECQECHLVIDRDYNGARNILLKNLIAIVQYVLRSGTINTP